MKYFFVFQNKTYNEESAGGYLWAPKHGDKERKVSHWDKMRQVRKGDIIIHSYNKNIKAISVALSDCYSADRPVELVDEWNNDGWRVDTEYRFFKNCIITSDHMSKLRELQPEVDAPFNRIGRGNTGYLFSATKEMFDYIMQETYKIQISKVDKDYVSSLFKPQIKYENDYNIPIIRIIPMDGPGEFPGKTNQEIQEEFFLKDLIYREGCAYYYRDKGLNSDNNSLLLFQCNNEIIACARLDKTEKFDELVDGVYIGAFYLYPDSINVFRPFDYDELKSICHDAIPFSNIKQKLKKENISALIEYIEKNSQGYILSDKRKQITVEASEKEAKKLGAGELLKRIKNNKTPKAKAKSQTINYYRDPYIKELVKRLAEGKCQFCGEHAPFKDKAGEPYLEEHHVVQLAHGGDDEIGNVVAICPNCHRKIHILEYEEDIKFLKDVALDNLNKALSIDENE